MGDSDIDETENYEGGKWVKLLQEFVLGVKIWASPVMTYKKSEKAEGGKKEDSESQEDKEEDTSESEKGDADKKKANESPEDKAGRAAKAALCALLKIKPGCPKAVRRVLENRIQLRGRSKKWKHPANMVIAFLIEEFLLERKDVDKGKLQAVLEECAKFPRIALKAADLSRPATPARGPSRSPLGSKKRKSLSCTPASARKRPCYGTPAKSPATALFASPAVCRSVSKRLSLTGEVPKSPFSKAVQRTSEKASKPEDQYQLVLATTNDTVVVDRSFVQLMYVLPPSHPLRTILSELHPNMAKPPDGVGLIDSKYSSKYKKLSGDEIRSFRARMEAQFDIRLAAAKQDASAPTQV